MTNPTSDTQTTSARRPWLFDSTATAIDLRGAVGFRVRYWPPGARGKGELLADPDTGLPRWSIDLEREPFCRKVRYQIGRYRLDPIDAHRWREFAPAIFHITEVMANAAGRPEVLAAAVDEHVGTLRCLRTQVETLHATVELWSELPESPALALARTGVVAVLTNILAADTQWRAALTELLAQCAEAPRCEAAWVARCARAVEDERLPTIERATQMLLTLANDRRPSQIH